MLDRDLYVQNSESLRNSLTQAVVERPVRISRLARFFGKTPPQNTGILVEEKGLYRTVQIQPGNEGQIQSAYIINRYAEDYPVRRDADAQLQFTPEGVVINESLKGGFFDRRIGWRALVNADGVEAEMFCYGVIEAWNEWNEQMAAGWHKRKIIIEGDKGISLAIKTKYDNSGSLIACALSLSSTSQPVDLFPSLSTEPIEKLKEKKVIKPDPGEINWAEIIGRDAPQEEIDHPFLLSVGSRLKMTVYLGVVKNSEKDPLKTDYHYTLRINPFTPDGEYDQIYYPNFFGGTYISPVLFPSLPEIAKQGYLQVNRFLPHVMLKPPFAVSEVDDLLARQKGRSR